MGLFGAINSLIQGNKQSKMARKINPVNTTYETQQPIQDLYNEGRNLYQGRMAGANQLEQNLLVNQANAMGSVDKNATSGSQALAVAAGLQGQTNQGFQDLQTKEAQDKQNRFGIQSQVSQLMAREGDKVYQDKLRNYYDDLNYKRGLEGAAMQNKAGFFGGLDDLVNTGVSLLSPGGAFSGMLGGKNGGGGGAGVDTSPYTMTRPNYQMPNIQRGPMPIPSNRNGLSY